MTKKAFTLIEILIVLSIFVTISLFLVPISISQFKGSEIETMAADITSRVIVQQQYAYTSKNSESYGIYFNTNQLTLYSGASFATADSTETVNLGPDGYISSINLTSGTQDLNFTKGTFRPNVTGTILVTNNDITFTISVNREGLIEYYKS